MVVRSEGRRPVQLSTQGIVEIVRLRLCQRSVGTRDSLILKAAIHPGSIAGLRIVVLSVIADVAEGGRTREVEVIEQTDGEVGVRRPREVRDLIGRFLQLTLDIEAVDRIAGVGYVIRYAQATIGLIIGVGTLVWVSEEGIGVRVDVGRWTLGALHRHIERKTELDTLRSRDVQLGGKCIARIAIDT